MASLKFRHYDTESELIGSGTIQAALNAFDVGTIVFIDDTQKQYIITDKKDNVVTYKIYYGKAAIVDVSGSGATYTLTKSDDSEERITINNVDHATSSDTADTAKSVAWANVTGKPSVVTTDTEQTITGAKIFNNNTTFKNEIDVESLTADSLLVTGSARFTNTINGDLKGNVEGNLTGNASTATGAAEFTSDKSVTLTGDVTGTASSKGGWSVVTTIANSAVTNAKLANSKVTIAGTDVSLGGSIAASTIGAALTTSAPAVYATNAGNASKAGEATKAINDSDGNAINTTYLKKSGGTVTGDLTLNGATTVNSTLTADSITAGNLTINGAAKFNNGLEGNLKGNVDGNATTATTCTGNAGTATTLQNTRKINGTNFNGSADIITSKWGTARNITISDGTNSGTATSVDGSNNITLNLPGTIKANLNGNADTATYATSAGTAGDANTIAEISASRLVYGSNSTKTTRITEAQLNAPLASGFYTIMNTTTGSSATIPNATNISMVLHTSYCVGNNNAGFDLLINDSMTSSLYFRPATGSGKGAWKTLIDTSNIGSQSVNYAAVSGSCNGNSATSTKATQDSEGNAINTTYLKRSGGTVTGNVAFDSSVTTDSLTTEDLIVNGAATFNNGLNGTLTGSLIGNANTASACTGNALTATTLQTSRTIWGQSFNGSGNVSGNMTNVGAISMNGLLFNNRYGALGNGSGAYIVLNKGGNYMGLGASNSNPSYISLGESDVQGNWINEFLTIKPNGNVGIGTTNSSYKLHVNGTGYFVSDLSSAVNVTAGGYIKGESVKISSGCTLEYSSTDKCVRFVFN